MPAMSKIETCLVDTVTSPASRKLQRASGATTFSEQAWEKIGRSLRLSGRELEIVRQVFDDRTEFAIANDLHLSPHTVHTHCERLYHKLEVTNRVRLVLRVTNEFNALTFSPEGNLPPICANQAAGRCPIQPGSAQIC